MVEIVSRSVKGDSFVIKLNIKYSEKKNIDTEAELVRFE